MFRGVGSGIRWFVAWLGLFLGSGVAAIVLGTSSPMPAWFSSLMLALNITVGGTIVFTLLALFAKQREEALGALRHKHERAESLLLNILPGSIAEQLKPHPETIAGQFTAASVLFADVVDFTPLAEHLPPADWAKGQCLERNPLRCSADSRKRLQWKQFGRSWRAGRRPSFE